MLAVAEIDYIRHEVNKKDCSYSDVAKRMGRDPRTVKKYAEKEDFSPEIKQKQNRPSPVMDPVKDIVDQWLLEDLKQKKKFRRTAKRIWIQLREEYGFQGSDRTIRNYISRRKKELLNEGNQAALPLEDVKLDRLTWAYSLDKLLHRNKPLQSNIRNIKHPVRPIKSIQSHSKSTNG